MLYDMQICNIICLTWESLSAEVCKIWISLHWWFPEKHLKKTLLVEFWLQTRKIAIRLLYSIDWPEPLLVAYISNHFVTLRWILMNLYKIMYLKTFLMMCCQHRPRVTKMGILMRLFNILSSNVEAMVTITPGCLFPHVWPDENPLCWQFCLSFQVNQVS